MTSANRELGITVDPDDILKVWAAMMFPTDDAAREQLITVRRTKERLVTATNPYAIEIDVGSIRALLDAPSYGELIERISTSTRRGTIAGDILATIYLMDKYDVDEPSFNKAVYVVSRFAKESTYGDGKKIASSERKLREYYREFEPVAHLWAAARLNRSYPYVEDRELFTEEGFPVFLGVAKGMYEFGTNFIPFRAKGGQPILNPESEWTISERIPKRSLKSKFLPDRMLAYLAEYRAPSSEI